MDILLFIVFLASLLFLGVSLIFSVAIIFSVFTTSFDILNLESDGEKRRTAISKLFYYTQAFDGFNDYASTNKRVCRVNGFILLGYLLSAIFFILLDNGFFVEIYAEPIFSFSSYFLNPLLFLVIPVIFWCISKVMVASNWTKLDYFLELKH